MASRRELLDSLKPGMHLDKNFFLKIYGYDITRPGFADDVIRRLEILGCSKARDYYTCIVSEYNHNCCLSRNGAPTLERDGSIKKRRAIK